MKKKLQKRAISLLLILLMVMSSSAPYTAYGGVAAGSNDNNAGGNRVPAAYNMHGWGALVTLVRVDNPYTENEGELDKLAEGREGGDETSVAIAHVVEDKYLKEFPDFWLKSSTAKNSCLIFISPTGKDVGGENRFVGTDGITKGTAIASSYRADKGSSSGQIKVVADVIRNDRELLEQFKNRELDYKKKVQDLLS